MAKLVSVGDYLGSCKEFEPSEGVYLKNDRLYSSRFGVVSYSKKQNKEIISVSQRSVSKNKKINFPIINLNSLVICKVKSCNDYQCKVDIFGVNGVATRVPYRGHIYQEDIRESFHRNFVKAYQSYCVGDIVIGRVIGVLDMLSESESFCFRISTNEQELGVVLAKSPEDPNAYLIPSHWREMMCPTTGKKYNRKVAKVEIREKHDLF